MGGIIYNTFSNMLNREAITYLIILGLRIKQNLYIAELIIILIVIRGLLLDLQRR